MEAAGMPIAVRQKLQKQLLSGRSSLPKPHLLQRRLQPFQHLCELLGGESTATDILERDVSIMMMPSAVLQRKLHNLQQLLSTPAALPAGSSSNGSSSSSTSSSCQVLAEEAAIYGSSTYGDRGIAASTKSSNNSSNSSPGDVRAKVDTEAVDAVVKPLAPDAVGAVVLAVVRSHPGVLRLSTEALSGRVHALQRTLGLNNGEEVLQVGFSTGGRVQHSREGSTHCGRFSH
jgi:hypothetical protein